MILLTKVIAHIISHCKVKIGSHTKTRQRAKMTPTASCNNQIVKDQSAQAAALSLKPLDLASGQCLEY
jgi:hypothetical protein